MKKTEKQYVALMNRENLNYEIAEIEYPNGPSGRPELKVVEVCDTYRALAKRMDKLVGSDSWSIAS